ncbi:MAG: hypothetical protein K2N05_07815 [Muribaculaceae bacterium]|nr:hypothetical protein [Muribaculaceae bacterium]
MKKLILTLATIISSAAAFGINPQYQKFLGLKYRYPCENFEKGKFQSITGKFNGKTTDTITLFPYDGEWDGDEFLYDEWILISKNGTVPSKIISSYYPDLVYEGDLDGNGTDEFGVLHTGMMGCWNYYSSFTVYHGKIEPFISVDWYTCDDVNPSIALKSTGTKGKVAVKYYNDNDVVHGSGRIRQHSTTKTITKFLK